MAVAYRSSSNGSAASGNSSITIPAPAGVQQGDLLIALVGATNDGLTGNFWLAAAGWTLCPHPSMGNIFAHPALYYKIATSSEPSSYTFTQTRTTAMAGAIVAYSGVNAAAPFAAGRMYPVSQTSDVGGDFSYTAPKAGVWVGLGVVAAGGTPTAPTGSTLRQNVSSGAQVLIADGAVASGAATPGFITGGDGGASSWIGSLYLNADTTVTNGIASVTTNGTSSSAGISPSSAALSQGISAPGMLGIVAIRWSGNPDTVTPTTGWTQLILRACADGTHVGVYSKLLTASDLMGGSWLWTWSGSIAYSLLYSTWSSANPAAPINNVTATDYSATAAFGFPAIASPTGNGAIVAITAHSNSSTDTVAAALTQRATLNSSGGRTTMYDAAFTSPAGPYTHTVSTADTGSDIDFAISAQAAPLAPTLTAPANASYQDLAAGATFSWTYNAGTAGNTTTGYSLRRKISGAGSYEYWNVGTGAWQATQVWNNTTATSVTFAAGLWADGNIYNWSVASQDQGGQGPFATDFTVDASAPPAVTVIAPTGTTNSASPTVSWSDTLAGGASQTGYRIVVESGGFGSTPGSGVTAWDSGVTSSAAPSAAIPVALNNATTYRVFVQVTETGGQSSAWGFSTVTVAFDAPAAPTVTAVWDNANARTVLNVQGRDNLLTTDDASFETTAGTWTAQTNCTVARSTTQAMDGIAALAMTSSAAGSMTARTAQGTSGYAVMPSKPYSILASFRANTAGRTCTVTVNWWQASGAASTIRTADTSTGIADTATGWVTTAALNVTSPSDAAFASISVTVAATAAANEVHYLDQVDIGPGTAAPWTRGGLAGADTFAVQRSYDQTTWTTIRTAVAATVDSAADQTATVYDYETPASTQVYYRAIASFGASTSLVTSAPSAVVNVTPTMTSWWIKDPLDPTVNTPVNAVGFAPKVSERAGTFNPAGRGKAVVVADAVTSPLGLDGEITVSTFTQTDWPPVLAIMTRQHVLLLQAPWAEQWYVRINGDRAVTLPGAAAWQRQVKLPYVEVDVP
jgi:hypothetical protein